MASTLACQRPKGEATKMSGGAGYPGPQSTRPGPGRPPIAGVEPLDIVPGDAAVVPSGELMLSVAGKPPIAVPCGDRLGRKDGPSSDRPGILWAVGQVPALRQAQRAR
jgi:hypothetical protein